MLHMDLFGPTNVKSSMKKSYVLVVTDDFSRFSGVFFLATKGETSGILKTFITGIENQLDCKVKVIRCDNGTEFKNSVMNQFYKDKEAVRTACYVLNRALVTKPHNKIPYELIRGRPPLIEFMKPFRCPVTILNTRDNLGKFKAKADEGYFVRFQENSPNVKGNGPDWLFDIDSMTISLNYVPIVSGNQTNGIVGSKQNLVAGQDDKKKELKQEYILIPICTTDPLISQGTKDSAVDAGKKAPKVDESKASDNGGKNDQVPRSEVESLLQQERQTKNINSTNSFNTVSSPVNTIGSSFVNAASQTPINAVGPFANDTRIFGNAYDDEVLEEEQSQELKNVSYHKLYDILKQRQHEVNEIQAEKIARVANPLALVAQQQQVYHPQTHPTHYNQHSSTRTHQVATRKREKAIVNSPQPIYDQEPSMVDDDEMSKEKEIDKLMALISLDNSPRNHRNTGYESQRSGNVAWARETVGSSMKLKRANDTTYHREKMLLCKQEEAGISLNAEQADWKDDTDDESNDQELEAHYMYMAKLQQVSPDIVDPGPIFDTEPEQKVQTDDHYDVFAIECQHPEQSESVHKTYLIEQDAHNVLIESKDMNYDSEQINQNEEDADLAEERCRPLTFLFDFSRLTQPPAYQAPAYQASTPQTQGVSKEDFSAYVKANDAVMRNMQTQGQNMQNQLTNLTDLMTKFVNANTASTSNSGTLPSNIIANLRSDLKAITTRSVNPTTNGNTEDVQPQAVHPKPVTSLISEPIITPVSASRPNPQASILYPSRRNDERNRERAKGQIEKFYQIIKDMSFEISFADALMLIPKFASTLKALIENKEKLSEMARTPLNEHCSAVLLKKLPEKLGDPCKF
nr:hypothetical protein [Tanacetum cinerariifolium]